MPFMKGSRIYSTVVEHNTAILSCAIKNGFVVVRHGQTVTRAQKKHYPLEMNALLIVKDIKTA